MWRRKWVLALAVVSVRASLRLGALLERPCSRAARDLRTRGDTKSYSRAIRSRIFVAFFFRMEMEISRKSIRPAFFLVAVGLLRGLTC